MNEADLYYNVVISLMKFIEEFRQNHAADATYVDWDAHAQISELPKEGTLIGPAGCGLSEETTKEYEVVFSFGISTVQDENLFKLKRLVSTLFGMLTVGKTIPVYDATSGALLTNMVIRTPRAVTPVTKAEVRSLQFIELSALVDPSATSSLL